MLMIHKNRRLSVNKIYPSDLAKRSKRGFSFCFDILYQYMTLNVPVGVSVLWFVIRIGLLTVDRP